MRRFFLFILLSTAPFHSALLADEDDEEEADAELEDDLENEFSDFDDFEDTIEEDFVEVEESGPVGDAETTSIVDGGEYTLEAEEDMSSVEPECSS
jgi:hypothetical protein